MWPTDAAVINASEPQFRVLTMLGYHCCVCARLACCPLLYTCCPSLCTRCPFPCTHRQNLALLVQGMGSSPQRAASLILLIMPSMSEICMKRSMTLLVSRMLVHAPGISVLYCRSEQQGSSLDTCWHASEQNWEHAEQMLCEIVHDMLRING